MTIDTASYINLIRERSGISVEDSRIDILIRTVTAMSEKKGITSSGYFSLIVRDKEEFSKFLNLLTINETYFFREAAQIDILVKRLIPKVMMGKTRGKKTRILSAGCSTGEEPYSFAMAIHEKFGDRSAMLFSITGIDIDGEALSAAEEGAFSERSFRGTRLHLLDSYLDKIGPDRYKVKKAIREMVDFRRVNLSEYPYPEAISNMDIIFYRNVSIYFDKKTQKRTFSRLSQILNENGYIVVSSTETLSHDFHLLDLIEVDGYFIFQKKGKNKCISDWRREEIASREEMDIRVPTGKESSNSNCRKRRLFVKQGNPSIFDPKFGRKAGPLPVSWEKTDVKNDDSLTSIFEEAMTLTKGKQYEKALSKIEGLPENRIHAKMLALKAWIMINLNRLEDAQEISLKIVGTDPMFMEGYLLSGIVHKLEGKMDDAISNFKKAKYLQASSWFVHFHLGEIYQSQNEDRLALQAYQMVLKCLGRGLFAEHGLTFFPNLFSEKEIRRLCEKRLNHIKARRPYGI